MQVDSLRIIHDFLKVLNLVTRSFCDSSSDFEVGEEVQAFKNLLFQEEQKMGGHKNHQVHLVFVNLHHDGRDLQ